MAHEKTCPGCRKQFWGNINKKVCSDSCRKYCSRHGIDIHAVSNDIGKTSGNTPSVVPQQSGKARTSGGNGVINYAVKRLIDVGAYKLKNLNTDKNEAVPLTPIAPINLLANNMNSIIGNILSKILLSDDHAKFLGEPTTPARILVWGKPGSGKSTYSLMLANQFTSSGRVLFVSGEERSDGKTFQNKLTRTIQQNNKTKIDVISRLPTSAEWKTILYDANGQLNYKFIIYDSIQILKMDPFYIKNIATKLGGTDFTNRINHVYISYADKEGTRYSGQAAWGHEVDIEIKCELGKAIIVKDRFATVDAGLHGAEFIIY